MKKRCKSEVTPPRYLEEEAYRKLHMGVSPLAQRKMRSVRLPRKKSMMTSHERDGGNETKSVTTSSTDPSQLGEKDDVLDESMPMTPASKKKQVNFQYAQVNTFSNFNRDKWPRHSSFLLMLIGYTIGLGNIWRFPFLCHKNGGAIFFIPYVILILVEGLPLYYMELCIGQRLRKGSFGVWNAISPYLGGLGMASMTICVLVGLYYNVIVAWCMFYFVSSFKDPLPWTTCPKYSNGSTDTECIAAGSSRYFWYRNALNAAESIESENQVNYEMSLSLFVAWLVSWLCMIKGIRSEGKIVYLTATLPIILLACLFFRGVQLPGFQNGLALLFVPDPELSAVISPLIDYNVWLDAAKQVFFSLGIAYGSLVALASYNPLKNDTTRDACIVCLVDTGVSVYASVVLFCFIGYRAHLKTEVCLNGGDPNNVNAMMDMASHGNSHVLNYTHICNMTVFLDEKSQSTTLAFISMTESLSTLPHASLWCVLFFFMLLLLGIDTQFGMMEGLVTPILDSKFMNKTKRRKEIVTGIVCLTMYILSLTMVQNTGYYWFQIFENYCSGIPLLTIALVECIAVSYVYGTEKMRNDVHYMTNRPLRAVWVVLWKVVSPLLIFIVLVFSVHQVITGTPTYLVWNATVGETENKPLPPWSVFLSAMLIVCSVVFIPAVVVIHLVTRMRKTDKYRPYEVSLLGTPESARRRINEEVMPVTVL